MRDGEEGGRTHVVKTIQPTWMV
eukprot:COSAG01_NODE_23771_length_802_cov_1.270270_2_plen_22_part_01